MMMTDLIFRSSIMKLEAAFRHQSLSKQSLEIYFEKLKDIPDKTFLKGVDEIIDTEDFFPSIHKMLKYCRERGVVL